MNVHADRQVTTYRDFLDGLQGPTRDIGDIPAESAGRATRFHRTRQREQERLAQNDENAQTQTTVHTQQPAETTWKEVTVDKNGQVRQAGASMAEGAFVKGFKEAAEKDLYVFAKGVMGRRYLTKGLHLPICRGLQKTPPFRKLRLLPRDHAKTSIVSHCLPIHITIQEAETNPYFPGLAGTECRIMLAGETERRAKGNLRVVATTYESNKVLRALWPGKTWEKPKAQARKWSDEAIILPRENEYPDPTIFAIGVGGAITGARPNVQIKDDLISLEAANSDVVMQGAIEWHRVSRALMDEYEKDTGLEGIELLIGTRWAVYDLYSEIIDNDPTVDVDVRSIIENGKSIWPERFPKKRVEQLQKEFGAMFYLLYMNSVGDPELVDFDIEQVRSFKFVNDGKAIEFDTDSQDGFLLKRLQQKNTPVETVPSLRGQKLNADTLGLLFGGIEKGRTEYFKYKEPPVRLKAA